MQPWTEVRLEGERIRLRSRTEEDAEPTLRQLRGEPALLRWLPWEGPRNLAEARELPWFVATELGVEVRLALVECASDHLVGGSFLRLAAGGDAAELGYWVGLSHQGRGFATEAVGLLAHLAFDSLGAGVLTAKVQLGNAPSLRVLEKAGFMPTIESPAAEGRPGLRHLTLLPKDLRAAAPRVQRVVVGPPAP